MNVKTMSLKHLVFTKKPLAFQYENQTEKLYECQNDVFETSSVHKEKLSFSR